MTSGDGKTVLLVRTDNNEKAAELLSKVKIKSSVMSDGVHVETTKERVPEIITTLTAANLSVYGMDKQDAQSLEDVFMKLTGEGK